MINLAAKACGNLIPRTQVRDGDPGKGKGGGKTVLCLGSPDTFVQLIVNIDDCDNLNGRGKAILIVSA